jgi:hypothetical protein
MKINLITPFTEHTIQQEYALLCDKKNTECYEIHSLMNKTGTLIFDLWLTLDLLLSITVDFAYYEEIYENINNKINEIKKTIIEIKAIADIDEHSEDTQKLLSLIEKMKHHQIIRYTELLYESISKCENELKKK